MSSTITITFWGRLSDQFGRMVVSEITETPTIRTLRAGLGEALANANIRAVLNGKILSSQEEGQRLSPGDKVEFMPPVGGG